MRAADHAEASTYEDVQRTKDLTMTIVTAPFSHEQVINLNAWQRAPNVHPFTCGVDHPSSVSLVATTAGWVCSVPTCSYTQDWAHDFMAKPIPPAALDWMTRHDPAERNELDELDRQLMERLRERDATIETLRGMLKRLQDESWERSPNERLIVLSNIDWTDAEQEQWRIVIGDS